MKKTGRRPGSQPTRREIVDAARVTFAAEGFQGATYRLIAQAADVDPALIRHYFGSKEKLFAETLEFPEGAPDRVRASLDGDPSGLGERLARAYLGLWEDLETRHQMVILTRSGTDQRTRDGSSAARHRRRHQPGHRYIHPGSESGGQVLTRDGPALRRRVRPAPHRHPPLRDLSFDDLIALIAPSIQLQLTGP